MENSTFGMAERRRSSGGSLHKMSKSERAKSLHDKEIDETIATTCLSHVKQTNVTKKDFSKEVRAERDIKSFIDNSEVLLDLPEVALEPIVDRLLERMVLNDNRETVTLEEIKSSIFADPQRMNLQEKLQGTVAKEANYVWEQTWICVPVTVPTLNSRHVGIARLKSNVNLGSHAEEIRFFILVLCPSDVKVTKTSLETARTFGTLFSDLSLRHNLMTSNTVTEFKAHILATSNEFASHQALTPDIIASKADKKEEEEIKWYQLGRGLKMDFLKRIPYYLDDYKDGLIGPVGTIQKTVATTLFLYFSVILPAVALGVLNDQNTHGKISVYQVIVGQTFGAIIFAVFSGQPLVVVMTTAPLALFIKIIYSIASDFGVEFLPFYAAIGLWNTFFLFLYSFFNMSVLMKFSSRSTEEIFSNFITIAFIKDSTTSMVDTFRHHYWSDNCINGTELPEELEMDSTQSDNLTVSYLKSEDKGALKDCNPDESFLALVLMLGTLWLGVTLFNFKKTPFLSRRKREILSDYALPVSVIVFSLIGTQLFGRTGVETFPFETKGEAFKLVNLGSLSVGAIFGAMGLGFSLSLLFFMDQNISAAMVDSPENKLVKGNAYHWDLLVVGLINGVLCIFGLPFMHAVLPHSPLHVKCLADTEEHVEAGHVKNIVVYVRETRLTNLFSNILIGLSLFFLSYALTIIPTAVLDGLFLYLAVTALYGNQMFERILLFFMEQAAYPPNHYVRMVPESKMHRFTVCQLLQLAILCAFGFNPWPYAKMIFPLVILAFLPIRHKLIPFVLEKKYLDVLDGGD